MKFSVWSILIIVVCLFLLIFPTLGCSEFLLKTSNPGSVVSGRTFDFLYSTVLDTNFAIEPRGQNYTSFSSLAPPEPGLSWNNTYGFVGVGSLVGLTQEYYEGRIYYQDALNEAGLSASLLWLNEAQFPLNITTPHKALLYLDLPAWIAGNFKTVDEVKAGLASVEVWGPEELDSSYPLHLSIHDAKKKSMIVEWVKDRNNKSVMKIYDGEKVDSNYGVMTNSPEYPAQIANLRNYQSSSPKNHFKGLPGGVSSIDRFIRLSKLNEYNLPIPYEMGDITQAFHLLNAIDVVYGTEPSFFEVKDVGAIPGDDYTYTSLVRDHINLSYYFRSWRDQSIRKIDFSKIDFKKGSSNLLPADPDPNSGIYPLFTDVTDTLQGN